jgi:uncharacterized membrane-anchored protein YjiN (DUF445 family)
MALKDLARAVRKAPRLEQRILDLEAEVQECRQVNLRLAELMDVVAELLLPVAQQDPARVEEALARYHASVGGPQRQDGDRT